MSQISAVTSLEETPNLKPEPEPKSENATEEYEEVTLIPPLSSANSQKSINSPTVIIESSNETTNDSTENLSDDDISNPTTVIVTSPSLNSDLLSEQNDSNDPTSTVFLQANHRRNKSEPYKSNSTEDLPSSTINESSISNNARDEPRRKSSSTKIKQIIEEKTPPTSTRKKKAWYNPFQSTYRQRNEEFRKIFKDLPNDERLIVDYSCAWQKDILAQGRMYLSINYLCFYANILNWKSSLSLKFKDIVSITREKTAKVISNAIEVKTNKNEKYFFASFVTRDKTFALIYRLWQAAIMDQPIPPQQLWVIIHENYGDDLDMTTDDEDDYHKRTLKLANNQYDLSSIVLRIPSPSKQYQPDDDRSSISSRGDHQTDDESIRQEDLIITDETISLCYLTECLCQSHLATQLINRTYSMSVEHLFGCIFGQNDFITAYRTARRIKDYHANDWHVNNETGKRERMCTYKVSVAAVFGSTTICSNERQVIDCELSKSHYIIDTEVRNEGIKYADSFYVATRYCLIQIGPNKSHLKVTSEVRYVKSLMVIIKTFIEKNAMAALQDSYTDLSKRLDHESSKQSRIHEKPKSMESEPIIDRSLPSDEFTPSIDSQPEEFIKEQTNNLDRVFSLKNTYLIPFCIVIMILLLIVNIFLCIKLNQIDQMTDRLMQNHPSWLQRYPYQEGDNHWSSLLKNQEEYYQTQLNSLHNVLTTTHNALKNVTNALNQLSQLRSRSS